MAKVKMVVVGGVRYRPEDAPETRKGDGAEAQHKARKPSRTAQSKQQQQ